jgi:hypothetical protein
MSLITEKIISKLLWRMQNASDQSEHETVALLPPLIKSLPSHYSSFPRLRRKVSHGLPITVITDDFTDFPFLSTPPLSPYSAFSAYTIFRIVTIVIVAIPISLVLCYIGYLCISSALPHVTQGIRNREAGDAGSDRRRRMMDNQSDERSTIEDGILSMSDISEKTNINGEDEAAVESDGRGEIVAAEIKDEII